MSYPQPSSEAIAAAVSNLSPESPIYVGESNLPFFYVRHPDDAVYLVERSNPLQSKNHGNLLKAYPILCDENDAIYSVSDISTHVMRFIPGDNTGYLDADIISAPSKDGNLNLASMPYFVDWETMIMDEPEVGYTSLNPNKNGDSDYAIVTAEEKRTGNDGTTYMEKKRYLVDLRHHLGEGGYGAVYMAYPMTEDDSKLIIDPAKKAAVKIVDRRLFNTDELKIQRQYYPETTAVVSNKNKVCMVMPYFPGRPLSDITQGKDNPDLATRSSIIRGIVQHFHVMSHDTSRTDAHLHLDAKEGNILYCGKDVYVHDFGLSKKYSSQDPIIGVSGTPLYLAPEKARGMNNIKSEIFSLGIIFANLLGTKNCLSLRLDAYNNIREHAVAMHNREDLFNKQLFNTLPYFGFDLSGLLENKLGVEDLPNSIQASIITFIQSMLSWDHERRPSMDDVLRFFVAFDQYMRILSSDNTQLYIEEMGQCAKNMDELSAASVNPDWQKQQDTYNNVIKFLLFELKIPLSHEDYARLANEPSLCGNIEGTIQGQAIERLLAHKIEITFHQLVRLAQSPELCKTIETCNSDNIEATLRQANSADYARCGGPSLLSSPSMTSSSVSVTTSASDEEQPDDEFGYDKARNALY